MKSGRSVGKNTLIARLVAGIVAVGMAAGGAGSVSGQDYPSKPIRIFASTPGGGTDLAARVLARGVAPGFSQPVIVENRAAFISIETVAKAPPDGHTLLVIGVPLWLAPFLQDNVPWDPVKDFQPITTLTRQPTFLVVHPSLPAKSVKELIALAKAGRGALNYGSGGTGTSSHLSAELFKSMAGVNITRVNYKGVTQAVNDLLGGQLQLMFATPSSVAAHVKSGRLKALAVSSAQPSALDPGLPPVARTLPGYELIEILGLLAPAKTPAAIVGRWNQAVVRFLDNAELKEKFFSTRIGARDELAGTVCRRDKIRHHQARQDHQGSPPPRRLRKSADAQRRRGSSRGVPERRHAVPCWSSRGTGNAGHHRDHAEAWNALYPGKARDGGGAARFDLGRDHRFSRSVPVDARPGSSEHGEWSRTRVAGPLPADRDHGSICGARLFTGSHMRLDQPGALCVRSRNGARRSMPETVRQQVRRAIRTATAQPPARSTSICLQRENAGGG